VLADAIREAFEALRSSELAERLIQSDCCALLKPAQGCASAPTNVGRRKRCTRMHNCLVCMRRTRANKADHNSQLQTLPSAAGQNCCCSHVFELLCPLTRICSN
jgi:hypothetical protein